MIRKQIGKKLNKKAFTLAETLVAVLILLMVSAILVTGLPAAKDAFEKVVVKSNAEMLMSTATYALRNELSTARDIKVEGTTISYISGAYGSGSEISVDEEKGIMYQRYALRFDDQEPYKEETKDGASRPPEKLVSETASDKLIIKYDSVTGPDANGVITFKNLGVYKSGANPGNALVTRENLSILTF